VRYLLTDATGSVRMETDSQGEAKSYDLDAFGNEQTRLI
jgi:hypothetical protein